MYSYKRLCEKAEYNYHCYSYRHVESATANTLFHKVKFGLQKAFCVVFEMSTSSKSISSIQMGKRFSIRQGIAWYFMQKVRKAMASNQKYPLSKLVHVDEFTIGGKEEGKQDRSYNTKKKKAVIAIELTDNNKVKRVYIKGIKDYSAKSLTPIFEEHISTSAKIVTDKWRGYEPLKELHIVIMQVKYRLRAIPTHVSKWHIQAYFDEFCFRINRSQFQQSIFHKTIQRMVIAKPIYHSKKNNFL